MAAKTLQDLFVEELKDVLNAEEQIIKALPNMINAADSADLKEAFSSHLEETRGQVNRLKEIFSMLQLDSRGKTCEAMKGILKEGESTLHDYPQSAVRDAALIANGQRVEHYEIAAYGTLRTLADELGHSEAADLLQATLDEEGKADKTLTKIAKGGLLTSGINQKANKE